MQIFSNWLAFHTLHFLYLRFYLLFLSLILFSCQLRVELFFFFIFFSFVSRCVLVTSAWFKLFLLFYVSCFCFRFLSVLRLLHISFISLISMFSFIWFLSQFPERRFGLIIFICISFLQITFLCLSRFAHYFQCINFLHNF